MGGSVTSPLFFEPRLDDIKEQFVIENKPPLKEDEWKEELTKFRPPKISGTVGVTPIKGTTPEDVFKELMNDKTEEKRVMEILTGLKKEINKTLQTEPDESKREGAKNFLSTIANNMLGHPSEKIETIAR